MAERAGASAARDAAGGRRAGGARGESGTMSLEVVLVVPALMLLALFVLWAGRGGRAGLIADLAAEEAATAASLGCERGAEQACEDLVGDVLSTRPGLDFLCIGGVRPDGPEGLVEHRWMRFGADAGGGGASEAAGVGLFGVGFVCETDGAVAPLRGVFPTVEFRGRGSEVAIEQGPPEVGISDAEAVEGKSLEFRLNLDSPAVRDVPLVFSIAALTGHTSAGACDSGTADYEQPPLTIVVSEGDVEATITVATCDDSVHEAAEMIQLTLDTDSVPPLDPDNSDSPPVIAFTDPEAVGTIIDNDAAPVLTVTAVSGGRVREGSGFPLRFLVELSPVGDEVVFEWDVGDSDLDGDANTDPAAVVCPDATASVGDPVDFIAQQSLEHTFAPSEDTQRITVQVEVCDDFIGEPHEKVHLRWSAPALGSGAVGVAVGIIEDDEPRLAVIDTCTLEGIEEADACALEADRSVVFTIERTVHPAVVVPPEVSFTYVTLPVGDGAGRHLASAGDDSRTRRRIRNGCQGGYLDVKDGPYYDYVATTGSATVPAGAEQTRAEVTVTVNNDAFDEHNETFMVMLCRPSANVLLEDPSGLGVIVDDDDAVTVAVSDGTATEPAGEGETAELSFAVTLSKVPGREVRVGYYTDSVERYQPPDDAPQDVQDLTATAGEDYTAVPDEPPQTLIFEAESDELTQTVTVAVLHDVLDEGRNNAANAETVALRLTAANAEFADDSGSCEADLVGNDCALGRIIDNDGESETDLVNVDDGLFVRFIESCLDTVYPGRPAVLAACAAEDEPNMRFWVTLVDADGSRRGADSSMNASARTLTVTYSTVQRATGIGAATGGAARRLRLGVDYVTVDAGTVDIVAGENAAWFTVDLVDDDFHEGPETFEVIIESEDIDVLHDHDRGVGVIIEDDPLPLVVVDDATAVEGEDAVFAVRLIDPADRDEDPADQRPAYSSRAITVGYHTYGDADSPDLGATPGQDYWDVPQTAAASFTFPPRLDTAPEVRIETVEDDVPESPERFQLRLTVDVDYASLHRNTAVGTITDVCIDLDDEPPDPLPELTTADVTVDEDVDPNKYHVKVTTNRLFCEDVRIIYSTSEGTGLTDASSGIDFEGIVGGVAILRAGSYTVTLEGSIIDDTLDEEDEQFIVTVNWDTTQPGMGPYEEAEAIQSTVTIIDDDDPPVVALIGPVSTREAALEDDPPVVALIGSSSVFEGTIAQYRIKLVSRDHQGGAAIASGKQASITYYTCCGTATPGDDYEPVPQDSAVTLVFPANSVTEHTVEIATHKDEIVELGGEEFQLHLGNPGQVDLGDANTVTTKILDISFVSVSSPHAIEGQTMQFHVSLSADPASDVTVQYATEDLSGADAATAGRDYTPVDSRDSNMAGDPLVFTRGGSLTQTVDVDLLTDNEIEGSEIFRLRLLSANVDLEHGANTYGTGTIHDSPACIDPNIAWHPVPTLTVDASWFGIVEGVSVTNTVRLSTPFCERHEGSLEYSILHGTTDIDDFPRAQAMTIDGAFEAGSTTDDYVFHTLDDVVLENDENFRIRVNWNREMCWNEQYCDQRGLFTYVVISDNDEDSSLPILHVRDFTLERGVLYRGKLTSGAKFVVKLLNSVGQQIKTQHEIRVRYETRNLTAVGTAYCFTGGGADYRSQASEIVFEPGDDGRILTTGVCRTDERRLDERFQLVLLSDPAPVGAVLGDHIGTGYLVGWADASLDNTNSRSTESRTVRIWVKLDQHNKRNHVQLGSVNWATEPCTPGPSCVPATAGVDYVSASGTLQFVDDRVRNMPIDIQLLDDNVDEPTEAFSVRLSNRPGDVMVNPAFSVANVWILDDDPTPTLDFETASLSVLEAAAFTFTVELVGTSDRTVTVDWATNSGGASTATEDVDYMSASGTLTFLPGATTANFTVSSIADGTPESDETFRVGLSHPSNALLARPGTFATATITDDDN